MLYHLTLPAYGQWSLGLYERWTRWLRRRRTECDRLEQSLAIPKVVAKFFEIVVRQIGEDVEVDLRFAERALISTKTGLRSHSPTSILAPHAALLG